MPFHYLEQIKKGWKTQYAYIGSISEKSRNRYEKFFDIFKWADIIVFPRLAVSPEFKHYADEMFSIIKSYGTKTIYEVDDDFTNKYRHVTDGEAIFTAGYTDAVTVTTKYLGETMHKETGRPYHILPNSLDPVLWKSDPSPKPTDGYLKIGLTGGQSHARDWEIMREVMLSITDTYPHVKFIVGGYYPPYFKYLDNVEFVPPLPYPAYSTLVRTFDIVLAPVLPQDGFNMGKSPIKVIEGMGAKRMLNGRPAGAAVIATRMPIYELAISHGKNGILTDHTVRDWTMAISKLIEDDATRHQLQYDGYRSAWGRYDITKTISRWEAAYKSVIGAKNV